MATHTLHLRRKPAGPLPWPASVRCYLANDRDLTALLGFFVIPLDALVVNVALPAIGSDLKGGMTGLQWVVDGYTLMFAALLLSAGALADRVGARRAFGAGLAVFVVTSVVCGMAPNLGLLVGAGSCRAPVLRSCCPPRSH